jgi:hypothetical protein
LINPNYGGALGVDRFGYMLMVMRLIAVVVGGLLFGDYIFLHR